MKLRKVKMLPMLQIWKPHLPAYHRPFDTNVRKLKMYLEGYYSRVLNKTFATNIIVLSLEGNFELFLN